MRATKPIRSATHASIVIPGALRQDAVTPPADGLSSAQPTRIVRSQYLWTSALEPAQRSALADRLYCIYSQTVCGETRDDFEAQVLGAANSRLALFFGTGDEIAGFFYARIEYLHHAGRRHAVFCAGLCFQRNYHGGLSAQPFAFRQALRFKLRQPGTPLALLTRCSSPAIYRLLASTMPRLYPNRRYQTPEDVEALVCEFSAQRRYDPVSQGHPWVVCSGATPVDASRLGRLQRDPDVRFYEQLNPRFAEGEALLVWMPLDAANIAGGIFRALRARLVR